LKKVEARDLGLEKESEVIASNCEALEVRGIYHFYR